MVGPYRRMELGLHTASFMCWAVDAVYERDKIYWESCGVWSGDATHPNSPTILGGSGSAAKTVAGKAALTYPDLCIRSVFRVRFVYGMCGKDTTIPRMRGVVSVARGSVAETSGTLNSRIEFRMSARGSRRMTTINRRTFEPSPHR